MPLRVEISSQIELVIRIGYFHHFTEVPRLEPRLKPQVCAVVLWPRCFGDEENIPVGACGRFPGRKIRGKCRITAHARSAELKRPDSQTEDFSQLISRFNSNELEWMRCIALCKKELDYIATYVISNISWTVTKYDRSKFVADRLGSWFLSSWNVESFRRRRVVFYVTNSFWDHLKDCSLS